MRLKRVNLPLERTGGTGSQGEVWQGRTEEIAAELLSRFAGQVQCIYLDPPFQTGKRLEARICVGEKDWRSGRPSMTEIAYEDNLSSEAFFAMIREALICSRELLSETGTIFVHIDYRTCARMRLMMDEIFGEDNFLNEIIWSYQTGGRSKRYFSRKHDTILFYRKSKSYYFDITGSETARVGGRNNHMKRHVDADGRTYRSIRSGGKVYTYYDDDPVIPGDVWTDVSHLQQKDPQRSGYDTQKPLALLNRIVRCASRPGDLVVDLFAGSGTTLVSAWNLGRRFAGVDPSPYAIQVMHRRLYGAPVIWHGAPAQGDPTLAVEGRVGVGYYEISLSRYELESGLRPRQFNRLDALDNWAVGYEYDGGFQVLAEERRSRGQPALEGRLQLPVLDRQILLRTGDVLGRSMLWSLKREEMEF